MVAAELADSHSREERVRWLGSRQSWPSHPKPPSSVKGLVHTESAAEEWWKSRRGSYEIRCVGWRSSAFEMRRECGCYDDHSLAAAELAERQRGRTRRVRCRATREFERTSPTSFATLGSATTTKVMVATSRVAQMGEQRERVENEQRGNKEQITRKVKT